ncbi:hypothetical protein D3C75_712740 [compost metagenome]
MQARRQLKAKKFRKQNLLKLKASVKARNVVITVVRITVVTVTIVAIATTATVIIVAKAVITVAKIVTTVSHVKTVIAMITAVIAARVSSKILKCVKIARTWLLKKLKSQKPVTSSNHAANVTVAAAMTSARHSRKLKFCNVMTR